MERGSAVILIGGKLRIGAQPAVAGSGSGWQWLCVAVGALTACVAVTGGSGSVAVGRVDGAWQCGHFDRWQVDNPLLWLWQWLVAVTGGSGWVAVAVYGSGCVWQWLGMAVAWCGSGCVTVGLDFDPRIIGNMAVATWQWQHGSGNVAMWQHGSGSISVAVAVATWQCVQKF
jgi:hypothetical protein